MMVANDIKGYIEGYRTGFKVARDILAVEFSEEIDWGHSARKYTDDFRDGVVEGYNDGVLFNRSIGL